MLTFVPSFTKDDNEKVWIGRQWKSLDYIFIGCDNENDKILLQTWLYIISFYWMWFLTNLPLDYNFFFFFISSILAKFPKDQISIVFLSIKCLNFKSLKSKIMHKEKKNLLMKK